LAESARADGRGAGSAMPFTGALAEQDSRRELARAVAGQLDKSRTSLEAYQWRR